MPKKEKDTLKNFLVKDEKKNLVTIATSSTKGAKEAISKYQVLSSDDGYALVELELLTGRTHQIRVQMANIGCPLAGDGKYGKVHGRYRQKLFSYRLLFHTEDSQLLSYLNCKEFKADTDEFVKEFNRSQH